MNRMLMHMSFRYLRHFQNGIRLYETRSKTVLTGIYRYHNCHTSFSTFRFTVTAICSMKRILLTSCNTCGAEHFRHDSHRICFSESGLPSAARSGAAAYARTIAQLDAVDHGAPQGWAGLAVCLRFVDLAP